MSYLFLTFEVCRIRCVKLVQELSGAHVSDKLDKLRLSGGNKMLAITVLNRNIPFVPDILRPMFSACQPPCCAVLLSGSSPKWRDNRSSEVSFSNGEN